jgi:hypothetical protein
VLGNRSAAAGQHRRLILGGVAFQSYTRPGWEEGDRVPVARWPGGRLFAKIGLWRRGPDPVVLSVADPVRIRGWSVNGTNTELELPPCGDRRWRVFPGGLLIPRPRRCVTLRVQVAEETAKVPFGLGVSC